MEGATAPTAEECSRSSVRNVCQIHQEKVEISYTKQASVGAFNGPSSAPYRDVPGGHAVGDRKSARKPATLVVGQGPLRPECPIGAALFAV